MNKLFNLIKRVKISLTSKDQGRHPTLQISYLGKTKNSEKVLPYGLYSNPKDKALAIVFNTYAQPENSMAIPYDPYKRFEGLKPGEVLVGNPYTNTYIYFKTDGSIQIKTDSSVNIDASNINLGSGGKAIARVDDEITGEVIIPSGSSAGTYNITNGKISTGSSTNTSN